MTITVSSLLLILSCTQYLIVRTDSFQISTSRNNLNGLQLKKSTQISSNFLSSGIKSKKSYLTSSLQNENKELQVFNSDAIIPKERWDFADDIYLITTTEKGSQRLERTKEQLDKVNMLDKVNKNIQPWQRRQSERYENSEKQEIFSQELYSYSTILSNVRLYDPVSYPP